MTIIAERYFLVNRARTAKLAGTNLMFAQNVDKHVD